MTLGLLLLILPLFGPPERVPVWFSHCLFVGILVLSGMVVTYVTVVRQGSRVIPPPAATTDLGLAVEQLTRTR